MKKYYKLVSVGLKSLGILGVHGLKPEFILQYRVGEWTCPVPGTNLFVFDSIQHARNFYDNYYCLSQNCYLFEAKVKSPRKTGLFTLNSANIHFNRKLRLQKKKYYRRISGDKCVPEGTVFCGAVKLLEQTRIGPFSI